MVIALFVTGLFVVAHDSAHGALFKSKRMNSMVGHVAMLPCFHVFEGWILGHNRVHHAYTVRQGYDFVWHPTTAEEFAAMGWGASRHRVEWSWVGTGAVLHPRGVEVEDDDRRRPARWLKAIRRDRSSSTRSSPGCRPVRPVGCRAVRRRHPLAGCPHRPVAVPDILLHDRFPGPRPPRGPGHQVVEEAEWTKFKAQMEGTTVKRVTEGCNFFFHWIMVHVPHHVDMRIPMYHLELAADAIKAAFPGRSSTSPCASGTSWPTPASASSTTSTPALDHLRRGAKAGHFPLSCYVPPNKRSEQAHPFAILSVSRLDDPMSQGWMIPCLKVG